MSKNKTKVIIIYGGPGDEHEVSLRSAQNIFENIDIDSYEVEKVYVTKELIFCFDGTRHNNIGEILSKFTGSDFVVFPVLHGEYGEDGTLQKELEDLKIRYIGSGYDASLLAMDKLATQNILNSRKIRTPKTLMIKKSNFNEGQILEEVKDFKFPKIIKPNAGGSSVGLIKINLYEELIKRLTDFVVVNSDLLIQEFVSGREFTCGVYENGDEIIALPVTEIILTQSEVFDYDSKYTAGACKEITPAEVDSEVKNKIQDLAIRVHEIVGAKDISRTDIILTKDGELYVLEINTIPGMTKTSFVPAQVIASGITFKDFINILVKNNL